MEEMQDPLEYTNAFVPWNRKVYLSNIYEEFNIYLQNLVVPGGGTMTQFGTRACIFLIMAFVVITLLQWRLFGISQWDDTEFQKISLQCVIVFASLFFSSVVMMINSRGPQLTCTMSAAAISLLAGSSHLIQSMRLSPVSETSHLSGHYTIHSKWAEWMTSVPLLIFVLGHVSQVRENNVFCAMAVQFIVILLGYIAEINGDLWIRLLCFIVATFLHVLVMLCIFVTCVSFSKLRVFNSKRGNRIVLNEAMIQVLGISTVLFWMAFPIIFILRMTETVTEQTYQLSYPYLDVLSKGTFIAILNAIQSEGEAKRMAAMVSSLQNDNKQQAQFLRFVYHEIRNPFNTIMLGLNHLEEEESLLPFKELITMLRKSASSMLQVVNSVVELTQSQELEIINKPFDIRETVLAAVKSQASLVQQKEMTVLKHISKLTPKLLLGDSGKLQTIFECLISNALKFSNGYSTIKVALKVLNISAGVCAFSFSVADSGPGISENIAPLLFKPFAIVRPGDFSEDDTRGAGLGLCFAKNLADLMGASLNFSNNKDVGTTFVFTFELETSSSEESRKISEKEQTIQKKVGQPKIHIKGHSNSRLEHKNESMQDDTFRHKSFSLAPIVSPKRRQKTPKSYYTKVDFPVQVAGENNMTSVTLNTSKQGEYDDFSSIATTPKRILRNGWGRLSAVAPVVEENCPYVSSIQPTKEEILEVSDDEKQPVSCAEKHFWSDPRVCDLTIVPIDESTQGNYQKSSLPVFATCAQSELPHSGSKQPLLANKDKRDAAEVISVSTPSIDVHEKRADYFKTTLDAEVLIVDDVKSNLKLIKMILNKAGYCCDEANNGKEAVELASQHEYKLIFMDNVMPLMDGVEATRQILRLDSKVTIVGVTGNILQKDQEEFLNAGVAYVIEKPANKAQLLEACRCFVPK